MSTPALPSDPDQDGLTRWYAIRYPEPGESVAKAREQLEALAVTVDAALHQLDTDVDQAVADVRQEFSGAATKAYVDAKAQAVVDQNLKPLPAVDYRVVGTRLAQVVETRADGTKNISTLLYSADQLIKVTQTNPARTITYTYMAGVPTGFTTSA